MKENQAKHLLQKYLAGDCTEDEKGLLETWYLNQDLDTLPDITEAERQNDLEDVMAKLNQENKKVRPILLWSKIAVAAMVIFALSAGLYFYNANTTDHIDKTKTAKNQTSKIKPGSNKAILILENGKSISLDDANLGKLAVQSGIAITKTADGQLVYTVSNSEENKTTGFNTIKTPRGGQYQVNLPDGTKVWLNAASSLKYPTYFAGNKREVHLTGEAYFEVAKDKTKPFRVISEKQTVQVLGTHFNVNSYDDEASTKTTLLEGSVKITLPNSNQNLMLKPGNQSVLTQQNLSLKDVDVEEAVSWKNGQFIFVNESLASIMRKLSRWYDVETIYKGDIANKTFSGTISKYKDVSEVLHTLELTKSVEFKISGNTITALKN